MLAICDSESVAGGLEELELTEVGVIKKMLVKQNDTRTQSDPDTVMRRLACGLRDRRDLHLHLQSPPDLESTPTVTHLT